MPVKVEQINEYLFSDTGIGIAIGIYLLSCVQAKVYVFEVLKPPSWNFSLAVSPVVP